MRKQSPRQRSLHRSWAEAGRNRGEGVSQWTGRTGHLPTRSARAAGDHWRWRRRDVGGGAGRAPTARMRTALRRPGGGSRPRRAQHRRCARWERRSRPALARRATRAPEACGGAPRRDGRTPVSSAGGSGSRARACCRPLPFPHEERGGSAWPRYRESAPGFPAHLNSASAPSARRASLHRARPSPRPELVVPPPPLLSLPRGRKVASPAPRPPGPRGRASTPLLSGVPTRADTGGWRAPS